jgi:Amt family ammonium transporter
MIQNTPLKTSLCCALVALLPLTSLPAQTPADSKPESIELRTAQASPATDSSEDSRSTLSTRVEDLEAYIKNEAPKGALSGEPGPGHNAWMMISTALVLFMTLPGLALFYGGLVRRKNVLSILAQCLALAGAVTVIWWVCGYSLCFAEGGPFLGGMSYAFLSGVGYKTGPYANWTSHNIWAIYQLTFAIITPALTIGAVAERMKFNAVMLFSILWMFAVYFPATHMMWSKDGVFSGLLNEHAQVKAIDFAGGIVVHMTSGWSALLLCILLGKRRGFGREPMPPHSMVLCMAGTGMLWVGWYGFNAGSAGAADRIATTAFVATTLSAAAGCCVWALLEQLHRGRPSVLGLCSGAVAGLATITPASGFVTANSAMLIGLIAGVATWFACSKIKGVLKYDDALDTFGVHAVGGTLGTLLAGFLADTEANPAIEALKNPDHPLWLEQIKAGAAILVWSVAASYVIYKIVDKVVGCRPDAEAETVGLDITDHEEEGYIH